MILAEAPHTVDLIMSFWTVVSISNNLKSRMADEPRKAREWISLCQSPSSTNRHKINICRHSPGLGSIYVRKNKTNRLTAQVLFIPRTTLQTRTGKSIPSSQMERHTSALRQKDSGRLKKKSVYGSFESHALFSFTMQLSTRRPNFSG